MQVTKTKDTSKFFNADRELRIEGSKYFYKDIDVTPIVKKQGNEFLSIMGRAGGKSFHNYFGFDKTQNKWYRFTGVTSALDYVGDKSNLIQWAANMVVSEFGWSKQIPGETAEAYKRRLDEEIAVKIESFSKLPLTEQVESIKKARTAHASFKNKTANLGKDVHTYIEVYIKDCIAKYEGKAQSFQHENQQYQNFINWAVKNKVTFKASELQIHSKKYWFAGTLDLVIEINGDLYLGDIKTTNSVWGRAYFAQCAAYRLALEETYPGQYKFAGSIVIRIGRDGLFNPEEDVHYSPYYEDDKKYFLAGLEVYRQENNLYQK